MKNSNYTSLDRTSDLPILLRMSNVSDESCRVPQNTHFLASTFFSLENPAVYEIMWKNSVETDRTPMTYGACALDAG